MNEPPWDNPGFPRRFRSNQERRTNAVFRQVTKQIAILISASQNLEKDENIITSILLQHDDDFGVVFFVNLDFLSLRQ